MVTAGEAYNIAHGNDPSYHPTANNAYTAGYNAAVKSGGSGGGYTTTYNPATKVSETKPTEKTPEQLKALGGNYPGNSYVVTNPDGTKFTRTNIFSSEGRLVGTSDVAKTPLVNDTAKSKIESVTFTTPSGAVTYDYKPSSVYAMNKKTGDITMYPAGSILSGNQQQIDPLSGVPMYGGLKQGEFFQALRSNVKPEDYGKFALLPALKDTYSLGVAFAEQKAMKFYNKGISIGESIVSPFTGRTQTQINTDYLKRSGLIDVKSRANVFNIYEQAYTSKMSNTGMTPTPTWNRVLTAPIVQTQLISGVGGFAGGQAIQQIGYLGKLPAVSQFTTPFISAVTPLALSTTSLIARNAITLGTPLLATGQTLYTQNLESRFAKTNYSYERGGMVLQDVTNFALGTSAFQAGLETPLLAGYTVTTGSGTFAGKEVKDIVINKGFTFQGERNAFQLRGTTLQGYDSNAGAFYSTSWGNPKSVLMPSPLQGTEFIPTSPVENMLTMSYAKDVATGNIVTRAFNVQAGLPYGRSSTIYNTDVVGNSEIYKQLPNTAQNKISAFLKSSDVSFLNPDSHYIYGGSGTKSMIGNSEVFKLEGYTGKGTLLTPSESSSLPFATRTGYRSTFDIDVHFLNAFGETKAGQAVNILKSSGVSARQVGVGGVEVNLGGGYQKFLDIHGVDNPEAFQAVSNAFAFKNLAPIRVGDFRINPLAQEATNKLASVGAMQPSGQFGVADITKRGKDYADYFTIQTERIFQSGGNAKLTAELNLYKQGVIENYGADVWTQRSIISLGGGTSKASASLMPSPVVTSAFVSPSPTMNNIKINTVPSRVSASQTSPSISYSPSLSYSPSFSPSPSASSKISYSLSKSVSASPSISYSPSASPSFSFSPSPSPSPSFSPSPSPSPGTPWTSPPIIPWFNLGGMIDLGGRNRLKARKKIGYTPSFTALVFNIRGKKPKTTGFYKSGLTLRPITSDFKTISMTRTKGFRGLKL